MLYIYCGNRTLNLLRIFYTIFHNPFFCLLSSVHKQWNMYETKSLSLYYMFCFLIGCMFRDQMHVAGFSFTWRELKIRILEISLFCMFATFSFLTQNFRKPISELMCHAEHYNDAQYKTHQPQ